LIPHGDVTIVPDGTVQNDVRALSAIRDLKNVKKGVQNVCLLG
jgi:hypothetical protein